MTLARMIRVNKISDTFHTPGLREMEEKDVPQVAELFAQYQKRFDMAPVFNIDEIGHQFLSGQGSGSIGDGGPGRRVGQVTWAYVVEVTSCLLIFLDGIDARVSGRIQKHRKSLISFHSTLFRPR